MTWSIPHLVIWFLLALAHSLLPIGFFRCRAGDKASNGLAQHLTIAYGSLVAVWVLSGALTALADPAPAVGELAEIAFSGLAPAVAGLAVVLEQVFIGEEHEWLWSIAGSIWGVLVVVAGVRSWQSGNLLWIRSAMAVCGWMALWAVSVVTWTRQYGQSEWTFHRNRTLYWACAGMLFVVGQALALFASWLVGAVGLILHLGGLGAVTVATTLRHLPNVRAVLRQGVNVFVMTSLMAVLLIVGWLLLSSLPGNQPLRPAGVGLAVLGAVILAFTYGPLHDRIVRLAERMVPRTGYDLDEEIREYSLAIGNIIDLEQLATVAVGTVSEVLEVQRAALILVTEENHQVRLRPLTGMGDFPAEEISFDSLDPVIEHIEGQRQPLFQYNLAHDTAFRNLLPEVQAWLQQMGMEVYVPIFAKSLLVGILATGPPRSGEPFGHRDRAFLTTLAQQTVVALQNARMFEDMRELNFEITKLNEDLRRAMERVERLDRAKTDFLAVASHELRTPLTHVKGYADLLGELGEAQALTLEQTADITHSIVRAVDRLETIVSAMIDMSQLDQAELDTFFAPTTLKAVMRIALEPWMQPLQLRRLRLTVQGVEDIPPIVADLQRLSQAFGNLISNAVKYTPDGGTITIKARQIEHACFEVVVSDTGVGIAPEDQDLIFDKFFRVGSADQHSSGTFKFKGGGPGLGLSIARGVIEAHGGRIWVESQEYDEIRCPGSEFHVVLPLQAHSPVTRPPDKVMPFTVTPEGL